MIFGVTCMGITFNSSRVSLISIMDGGILKGNLSVMLKFDSQRRLSENYMIAYVCDLIFPHSASQTGNKYEV
jgi:hypothetical protein